MLINYLLLRVMTRFSPQLIIVGLMLIVLGCDNPDPTPIPTPTPTVNPYALGYSEDDPTRVPTYQSNSSTTRVPPRLDFSNLLPPIANQGLAGTCVAWAAGYYARSAMYNASTGSANRNLASNQVSPEDLFFNIPPSKRGNQCLDGTQFESAYQVLVNRGAASLSYVPYTVGVNPACKSANTNPYDASKFRLSGLRKITIGNLAPSAAIQRIKLVLTEVQYPITFGCNITQSFYDYTGGIITANYGASLGGHALTIVGYDDAKNAFKIVNSWGSGWGEAGFAWVDYRFFVSSFVQSGTLYIGVAAGVSPNNNPNPVTNVNFSGQFYGDVYSGQDYYVNLNERYPIRQVSYDIRLANYAGNVNFFYILVNSNDINNYIVYIVNNPTISGLSYVQNLPLNGYYTPVLWLDPNNAILESNEDDNIMVGNPIFFSNGRALRLPANSPEAISKVPNWNQYKPFEIEKIINDIKFTPKLNALIK